MRLPAWLRAHRQRALARRSVKPAIGARIVWGDVRMTVAAGMSDELWRWLMERGWREPAHQPDRRRYREVPPSWVTRLIDASPERRPHVLQAAVDQAAARGNTRARAER